MRAVAGQGAARVAVSEPNEAAPDEGGNGAMGAAMRDGDILSEPAPIGLATEQLLSISGRRLTLGELVSDGLTLALDVIMTVLAGWLTYMFVLDSAVVDPRVYIATIGLMTTLVVLVFRRACLYDVDVILSWPRRMAKVPMAVAVAIALIAVLAFAAKVSEHLSRLWVLVTFVNTVGLIWITRGVLSAVLNKKVESGLIVRHMALVGAGGPATTIANKLKDQTRRYYRLVGLFDDRKTRISDDIPSCPLLGNFDELVRHVKSGAVDDVVVCLPLGADDRLEQIVTRLRDLPVTTYLASELVGTRFPLYGHYPLFDVTLLKVSRLPIDGWGVVLKWLADKILASLALIVTGPLLLLIAIAIKLDSPGPVFFRQDRFGYNDGLIKVFKFRSMYHNLTDKDAEKLASRNDDRITRVGRFLRRTSLDELPQLLNVLRGDMSMVGPRPHAKKAKAAGRLYQEVVARYGARHMVKPGITGWAQVNGWRGETDSEEKIIKRVEHDLYYIENWSIALDLKILAKTMMVAWHDNAY